jgi:sugar phosphate isomerase/epimerase
MRLAISNIAWERPDDESIADLLQSHRIDAIDIAPGKYFPHPASASIEEIRAVRRWWEDRGVEITGMQALLFGTSGLNVFGAPGVQDTLLAHLEGICRIGGLLEAPRIVFGSPRNRDRSALNDAEANEMATVFFRKLGPIAERHGVLICLEPNPVYYGANFMCTSDETAAIVEAVSHSSIRMQLDTGALTINAEAVRSVLQAHSNIIGHIHASEPDLVPLGDGTTDHEAMSKAISTYLPDYLVTIEMVATKTESVLASVDRAIRIAKNAYGTPCPAIP